MCNRSGGLIARAIEEIGIPTVVINQNAKVPERLKTPRAIVVRFPFGRPLGEPGNQEQHRVIAEDALQLLATAKAPNTIVPLPYRWKRTDFKSILKERKGQRQP